jgi:hypothetical protein
MPTVDLSAARWRKSSRSTGIGSNGACVEVALAGPAAAVRDSKNPKGPTLVFPGRAWRDLIAAAKADELGR